LLFAATPIILPLMFHADVIAIFTPFAAAIIFTPFTPFDMIIAFATPFSPLISFSCQLFVFAYFRISRHFHFTPFISPLISLPADYFAIAFFIAAFAAFLMP